ncbi:MAG: hypothetical protein GY737_04840, partial [Desulfobacteraceae bacterium]|nr:hypothetical protein [Desulfobacteraceae bacterium]
MDQIEWYERLDHPITNRLILRVAAASDCFKECVKDPKVRQDEEKWIEKVRKLALATPEDLLSLTPHQLRMVLTFFDAEKELTEISPYVHKQAAKTTSAELHLFLARLWPRCLT